MADAPAEPASVIVARQLAEKARLRRLVVRRRPPRAAPPPVPLPLP